MLYPGVTMDPLEEKKFEARIPTALWDQYEAWAEGRAKIGNRQLLIALFRLFLRVPEWTRLLALYGKDDQLAPLSNLRPEDLPPGGSKATDTDAVVADATRNVQARRSSPDRQQRRA